MGKKLLAILCAALLLAGLAACGGGGQDGSNTTEAQSTIPARPLAREEGTITLVAVFNAAEGGEGRKEYTVPYDDRKGVFADGIANALTELTGLNFALGDVHATDSADMLVEWAPGSSLFGGTEQEPREDFVFFDYDSMAWFMLDSLYETILRNVPGMEGKEVYYTMNGMETSLALPNLSPPMDFGLDTPYMGSAFYFAHQGGRGDDDIPIDPSDVNWWGEYGSEAGMLHINNYNDKGMGWSFHFTLTGDIEDDGVAAVDPDYPCAAQYANYDFLFDMLDETILLTVGGREIFYVRTEDAVG